MRRCGPARQNAISSPPNRSKVSAVPGTPELSWVNNRPPVLVSPGSRALEHTDRTGLGYGPDVLERGGGRQVREAVVIEVAGGQLFAELIPCLHGAGDLGEQPPPNSGQPTGRAVQRAEGSGIIHGPDVFEWGSPVRRGFARSSGNTV
jgi:hypothetical protein